MKEKLICGVMKGHGELSRHPGELLTLANDS